MAGARPAAGGNVIALPLDQIIPDPGQPRKLFDQTALDELARSIRRSGLLQPITVRQIGPQQFMIVAGERRWRAHGLAKMATVRAIVTADEDLGDIRIKQIIENDQRVDVTPLEQARSYQALMDETGWTVDQLAAHIGKSAHRIAERTVLLTLTPEYQGLLASGNLKPSEAWELARHDTRGQSVLFNMIRTGRCKTYSDLRISSQALLTAASQISLLPEEPAPVCLEDRSHATAFERNIEAVAQLLRAGISENQVTACRKVNPHKAGNLADLMAAMQRDLRRIELALRETAVQAEMLVA